MGDKSPIEWTDATWNPVRGCSRVSEGCRNCYAERVAARFSGPGKPYAGLATMTKAGPRWTGAVRFIPDQLDAPLRWTKPRRVFVNSMSDLFHEGLPDEVLDQVFAVMAQTPRHTYQILTKRPERMRAYSTAMATLAPRDRSLRVVASMYRGHPAETLVGRNERVRVGDFPWPLPNVWLGVSVEDQATADARVPVLLQTPVAVRFVSYEPAIGPVDFDAVLCRYRKAEALDVRIGGRHEWPGLHWLIVGGESGPGARPFDLEWARSAITQCRAAGVACFVKQLGARPYDGAWHERVYGRPARTEAEIAWCSFKNIHDRKGGDPAEWREDLRVREFPR